MGAMLCDLRQVWDKFGSERLSICTETSNRLSKKVITSPMLSPKLSQLTSNRGKNSTLLSCCRFRYLQSTGLTIKYHTKGQRSIFGKHLGKCQNSGSTSKPS